MLKWLDMPIEQLRCRDNFIYIYTMSPASRSSSLRCIVMWSSYSIDSRISLDSFNYMMQLYTECLFIRWLDFVISIKCFVMITSSIAPPWRLTHFVINWYSRRNDKWLDRPIKRQRHWCCLDPWIHTVIEYETRLDVYTVLDCILGGDWRSRM